VINIAKQQIGMGAFEFRIYQDPMWVTHELAGGRIRAVTKMLPTL